MLQPKTQSPVGFYNVGIKLDEVNEKNWKIKERMLKDDIVKAFDEHGLDILCLSELGELGIGLAPSLPKEDISAWTQGLLSDSAVPPVEVYANNHYVTLVKPGNRHG